MTAVAYRDLPCLEDQEFDKDVHLRRLEQKFKTEMDLIENKQDRAKLVCEQRSEIIKLVLAETRKQVANNVIPKPAVQDKRDLLYWIFLETVRSVAKMNKKLGLNLFRIW